MSKSDIKNSSQKTQRQLLEKLLRKKAGLRQKTGPMSMGQTSLFLDHLEHPQSHAYNLVFAFKINVAIDPKLLGTTFQVLSDRHEILRTTYGLKNDIGIQKVQGHRSIVLEQQDVGGQEESCIRRRLESDARRPFDLFKGPVIRACLYTSDKTHHYLMVVVHHIAGDARSLFNLVDELLKTYDALSAGQSPASFKMPAAQYLDFVHWENKMLAGPRAKALENFWDNELKGRLPILELPVSAEPGKNNGTREPCIVMLDKGMNQQIKGLARETRTRDYTIFFSAFTLLLHHYSGQDDLLAGIPTNTLLSLPASIPCDKTMGYMVNPVAIRSRVSDSLNTYLRQIDHTITRVLDHQAYPYYAVQRRYKKQCPPSQGHLPSGLFNVMFNFIEFSGDSDLEPLAAPIDNGQEITCGGLTLSPFPIAWQEGGFDLVMTLVKTGKRRHVSLDFNRAKFSRAAAQQMLADYQGLLSAMISQPTARVADLTRCCGSFDSPPPREQTKGPLSLGAKELSPPCPMTRDDTSLDLVRARLAGIWADILGLGRPPEIHEDFFGLGGHSLKLIRLASRINKEFCIKFSITDLFKKTILDTQARTIEFLGQNQTDVSSISKADPRPFYPLSNAQKRLWVLEKINTGHSAYTIPGCFWFNGPLDYQAFELSIHQVVMRHEALRTVFVQENNQPCQKILDTPNFEYEVLDIRPKTPENDGNNKARLEKQAIELAQQASAKAFNLETGPLLRVFLICTGHNSHLVLFAMHHIISDGWSLDVLVNELCHAYKRGTGNTGGKMALDLAPLSFQYKDFALWQARELDAGRLDEAKLFFKEMFKDKIPVLNLPTDYPRPRVQSFEGRTHDFELSSRLTRKIIDYCQANQVTLFMFFSTLVKILLYKYSGQKDLVVGSPVAGRQRHDLEDQIGLYMNTLALRSRISPEQGFADHLYREKETIAKAIDFQAYPYDRLVEEIQVIRRPDRSPLFDVMVLFQEGNPFALSLEGLDISFCPLEITTAKFDLLFGFTQGNCIQAWIEYGTALFSPQSIHRMQGHLTVLCQQVLDQPALPVSQMEIITPEEKQHLVFDLNDTAVPFPDDKTVVDMFEQTAAQFPGNIAVISNGQEWTYDQINKQANAIAGFLIEQFDIQPHCIGLMVKRSEKMISGILGILKSGAAYLPMDPHPVSRNTYILKDSGCSLVLVDGQTKEKFWDDGTTKTVDLNKISKENSGNPRQGSRPDSLAYVIYTSGSTGNPKGVMIEHRSVMNRIQWMQNTYTLNEADRIIQKTPFTFDVSVWELFWWSWAGAAVVMAAPGDEKDPARLIQTICDQKVSVIHFVPSMFTLFLEQVEKGGYKEEFNSLAHVFTSGEALAPAQVDLFNHLFNPGPVRLHNLYGPTEACVDVTSFECTGFKADCIPIGKPIDNTQIYILDSHGNPMPPGVDGEICIGGVNLARGYINNPGLTDEKFIKNRFSGHGKIYKTGDRGCIDSDGNVFYSGRYDFQVKIRGNRVEPGEIEACLLTHAGVKEAAVMARGQGEQQDLAAYVRLSDPGELASPGADPQALKTFVQKNLPAYMVPDFVVILDSFPLNPSGKTDRNALAAIEPEYNSVPHQPLGKIETIVQDIWVSLLGHDRIGPHDNFFDLGGNSLLLVRAHSALDEIFPGRFTVADLFIHKSITAIAAALSDPEKARHRNELKQPAVIHETSLKEIAVIGIGIRLADYDDLTSFEKDLFECRDRVGQLSCERKKDVDALLRFSGQDPDQVKFLEMAFLDRIDQFDCKAYKISPNEARIMAPEQRLFIETATRALAHAGYGEKKATGKNVGVFVGASNDRLYLETALRAFPEKAEQIFMGNVPSNMAGRLSFIMDWQGPAYMIDTACSSSLSAIHAACRSLGRGDCDMALAGAAKINLLPIHQAEFEIQSKDFRTRAFDDDADGTGGGEGIFAVLLKPLANAIKDKDPIHAVIKGSALNQDGHCAGLTIPNERAQSQLLCDAWKDAGIDPETLGFIEAHGTGTRLGDPIEIQGMTRAFEAFTPKKGFCAVGSVKTNFGHLDNAAGLAGFVKSVVCLKRKAFPGLVHFKTPNKKIPFDNSPVFPAVKTIDLNNGTTPLCCGVSSFGLSGINCHLVLEEAPHGRTKNEQTPLVMSPQRFWLKFPEPQNQVHPVSGKTGVFQPRLMAEIPDRHVYGFSIAKEKGWVLNEHQVNGRPALPGTAYFQMLKEVAVCHGMAQESVIISNLYFKKLFTPSLDQIRSRKGSPTIVIKTRDQADRVEVMAKPDNTWQTYLSATLSQALVPEKLPLDIQGIKNRLGRIKISEVRQALSGGPVEASDRWQCIQEIWGSNEGMGSEILGHLALAPKFLPDLDDFFIHPGLVDAAVSLGLDTPGFVPVGCSKAWFTAPIPAEIYSLVRIESFSVGDSLSADILITDPLGNPLAGFESFIFKRLSRPGLEKKTPKTAESRGKEEAVKIPEGIKFQKYSWQKIDPAFDKKSHKNKPVWVKDIIILNGKNLFADFADHTIPEEQDQVTAFVDELISQGIHKLVFAPAALYKFSALSPDLLEKRLEQTLAPLFYLAKSLATANIPHGIQLLILGRNTHEIGRDDPRLIPENALLEGFSKVIPRESPRISTRFLDFSDALDSHDILTAFKAFDRPGLHTVGLRQGQWVCPVLTPLATGPETLPEKGSAIKENKVYLITGGMGGMGLALAESMAHVPGIQLVLLGRKALPSKSVWPEILRTQTVPENTHDDASMTDIITRITAMENQGARILALSADVSDRPAMENALACIRKELGQINGVIHAAGLAGDGFIFKKDPGTFSRVMAPKVRGGFILDLLTREDDLDFLVFCSSTTALTGAPGQSDYTAANAYMDALSFARRRQGLPCLSINWPLWQGIGMAQNVPHTKGRAGLSGPKGAAVFQALLSADLAQAIVAFKDEADQLAPPNDQGQADTLAWPEPSFACGLKPLKNILSLAAQAWCDVLGHDEISAEDDFFDLGGDSITAMEVNHILTEQLGMDLTIDLVFEHSVLRDFAVAVEALATCFPEGQNRVLEIVPAPEQKAYPVSSSQRRLFFLHDIVGDATGYNLPQAYFLRTQPDPQHIEAVFKTLILRHETLRTTYRVEDDHLVQVIQEDWEFSLGRVHLDPTKIEAHIKGFSRPFNLDRPPLLRAELVCSDGQWLLLFDVHHIAADAMSLDILFKEFFKLYDHGTLPPVTLAYKDYTHWLGRQSDTRAFERSRAYYLDLFKGDLPDLAMPTDFPRPGQMNFEGDSVWFMVDENLFSKVKKMAANKNTTPFTIFLTAFFLFFHKHTHQEDIILLVADNGRDRPELAQMVGMFVNTLAMRAFPGKEKIVSDFIDEVKALIIEGFANKAYPFDDLVRDLNLPRDLSRSPLSDISFSYMNFYKNDLPDSSLEPRPYQDRIKDSSKFDLAIFATEFDNRVGIVLEYYSGIFKKKTVHGFGRRFLTLLENMTERDRDPIASISCLPGDEMGLILNQFSGSPSPYPKEKSLARLFWDQVSSAPQNIAVISRESTLNYRDLAARACDLAVVLADEYQVQPGEYIALMLGDSPVLAQSIIGILGAGCAYMPFDPSFPRARISHMLEDTGCRLCVTDTAHVQELKTRFPDLIIVDTQTLACSPLCYGDLPGVKGSGLDIAYVIYTSGTTGQPKGALVYHQSVSRLVLNTNYVKIVPKDRILKTATIAFDPSVFELFGALLNGAAYCIPEEKIILDITNLGQCIQDWGISMCQFTTSLFNALVEVDMDTKKNLFSGMRYVQIGGEKISSAHAAQFLEAYPEIDLVNAYGPTENAVITTAHKVTNATLAIPVGRPISNSSVYILDNDLSPVPIGVTGMIYTGGDGVFQGYLNQKTLTAQVLIDNPFNPLDRLYTTGDLGFWDLDGRIHCLGRKDSQVKIRGFRIEPKEIENCLMTHEQIGNTVVLSGPYDQNGDTLLAAYYTAPVPLSSRQIDSFLSRRLPAYMVPALLTQVDLIPLTPNGKIDVNKLPLPKKAMAGDRPEKSAAIAALDPTQEKVYEIWAAILGIETIDLSDDFFNLGGHSLKATRVISRVNIVFPVQFSVKKLFEYPVFKAFCREIDNALPEDNNNLSIPGLPIKQTYPLSFAQERLWFLDRLITDNPFYNIPFVLKMTGDLNLTALEQAINTIMNRHESLRTFFKSKNGVPKQKIVPYTPIHLTVIDLIEEEPKEVQNSLYMEAARVFDLSSAPLVQIRLFCLGPDTHILSWTIHHIVADGWSMGILTRELGSLYQAFSRGSQPVLPPLEIQYRDFAQWQRSPGRLAVLDTQKAYWLDQLEGFETLALPTDRPRPKLPDFTGDHVPMEIGPELTALVHARARETGASIFMILMGVFALVLSRYSGQEDIVAGTAIANRNKKEIEPLIGFFVNTLVLRFDLSADLMVDTFFDQVRAVILDAYANQDFPFEKLVESLVPEREIGGYPITQVNLTFQNMSLTMPELPGLSIEALNPETHWVRFDLEIGFWEEQGRIMGNFSYSTELFDRTTIEKMAGHFNQLLASMMESSKARLADLSMLTPEEISVLHNLALTPGSNPNPFPVKPVWQQIDEQAIKTPHAPAIMDDQGRISYENLVRQADVLAARLVSRGAGPGIMVGVCMPREKEAVIAVLAIFKAGAVYVPIDPSYPTERINYYIKDAKITLIVTRPGLVDQGLFTGHDLTFIFQGDKIQEPMGGQTDLTRFSPMDMNPDPSYLIYTSGSTGNPKGVMVCADSFARHIETAADAYEITNHDRILQFPSLSFDVSLEQIFVALTRGAVLVMRGDALWSMEETLEQMDRYKVSVANFTPTYFLELMKVVSKPGLSPHIPKYLRLLISGGEAMHPDIVRLWQKSMKNRVSLMNAYGPTETIITGLIYKIDPEETMATNKTIPLGRPLAGRNAYVMDKNFNLVPKGLPGELILGGQGMAQGYLGRPQLTREKFIISPFAKNMTGVSGPSHDRMYRTGDLVRWGKDGNLHFLGRTDNQIKVRGFRMEPEEIERCLSDHPLVSRAAVAVKGDGDNEKQLVGYLVPELDFAVEKKAEQNQAVLDRHKTIHNHYTDTDSVDMTFNISGWNSSYTGRAIPQDQMRSWVDQSVDRIMALSPEHVLEIGCGTGLILARIAPGCKTYTGIDFSQTALDFTQQMIKQTPGMDHVSLMEKQALDLDEFPPDSFDTIIINSVVQYFPDMEYLLEVIEKAITLLVPGGSLFLGDIKNLKLQQEFYFSVESFKQGKKAPLKSILKGVNNASAYEEELFVDPKFFYALPKRISRIGHVAVEPKPGGYDNEMSRFRYDVCLVKQGCFQEPLGLDPIQTLTDLKSRMEKHSDRPIRVPAIANARNLVDCRTWHQAIAREPEMLSADLHLPETSETGVDPKDIIDLCRSLKMRPEFHIKGKCHFDLILRPQTDQLKLLTTQKDKNPNKKDLFASFPAKFTNQPALGMFMKTLVPRVRDHALACLPGYMVPQFLMVLDELPMLPGGKINRNALPTPGSTAPVSEKDYVEPITDTEKKLAAVWQDILGIPRIGIHDNFFRLGGQSLLAVSLVSRINTEMETDLALSVLFQNANIHALAKIMENDAQPWSPLVATRTRGNRNPLFCFSPIGGNIYAYENLADELDRDIPFYVLQAKGLEKGQSPLGSIEEMAAYNIDWIRSVWPGPFCLSGWSLGGLVAFEAARQLKAQGAEIDFLALFDSSARKDKTTKNLDMTDNAAFLKALFSDFFTISMVELQALSPADQADLVLEQAKQRGLAARDMTRKQLLRLLNVYKNNGLAAQRYTPGVYDGRIHLFKPEVHSPTAFQYTKTETQGWEDITEDIVIHRVPGAHETMLKPPHVTRLAEILNRLLLDLE